MLKLSIFAVFVLFLFSCKKKQYEEEEAKPIVYPSYSNFIQGSYWVYQNYFIDSGGNEILVEGKDSAWVDGDTIIRGQVYNKVWHQDDYGSSYGFYRDSLHYLIDIRGQKMFSSADFSNILFYEYIIFGKDTSYKMELRMEKNEEFINTPAGNFKTRNMRTGYHFYPGQNGPYKNVYAYTKYAENIGKVSQDYGYAFGSIEHLQRRLLRYKINK